MGQCDKCGVVTNEMHKSGDDQLCRMCFKDADTAEIEISKE